MSMDYRYMAYPFLKEESRMCDYEVATDELTSMIGYAIHLVKHVDELPDMVEVIYHLNGSIRGQLAIDESDLGFWNAVYDRYVGLVGEIHYFVLPMGCLGASYLHILRSKIKSVLRIAYAIDREEKKVSPLILDLLNVLSNLLFYMCLHENACEGVTEVKFGSKSYGNR